ncbi:MAG: type 1 glutamine amidotransferase [Deltaproteobacteria bacterium]|nr:type 1 glutamine amidotransferase [Deltaproteobacteria bacterium]
MRRVLILDGSIFPEMYTPTAGWRQWLGEVASDSVHLPSGGSVPDLAAYSHLIVTGSESSIVRPEPWFEAEAEAVRRAFDRGIPILGSCFGHQMLARTLSGLPCVARSTTPEIGWVAVEWTASDPLIDGLPNPTWMFTSHFDEVRDLPAPWKVLGKSAGCRVAAMRFGDRPIWGIQPHPEITPREGRILMEGFLARAPDKASLIQPALAQQPRDDAAIVEIVRRFLG